MKVDTLHHSAPIGAYNDNIKYKNKINNNLIKKRGQDVLFIIGDESCFYFSAIGSSFGMALVGLLW